MKFKFTFWKLVFAIIMVLGGYATVIRFTQGLGASTNMNDQYPWVSGSALTCSAA